MSEQMRLCAIVRFCRPINMNQSRELGCPGFSWGGHGPTIPTKLISIGLSVKRFRVLNSARSHIFWCSSMSHSARGSYWTKYSFEAATATLAVWRREPTGFWSSRPKLKKASWMAWLQSQQTRMTVPTMFELLMVFPMYKTSEILLPSSPVLMIARMALDWLAMHLCENGLAENDCEL